MDTLIALGIFAGIAVFELLRTYKGREIRLPDEPAQPATTLQPEPEAWVELWSVEGVSVLFKPRSIGGSPPRLRVASIERERSRAFGRMRGKPKLGGSETDGTLFEAVPSPGPWLANRAESGDPALDRQVAIGGHPLLVAAALDRATRESLIKLFDESFAITPSGVVSLVSTLTPAEILKACPALAKLAKRLSPKRSSEEHRNALIRNLHDDPVPDVRAHNLQVLLKHYISDPVVMPIVHEAIESVDPRQRLIAATYAATRLDPRSIYTVLLELARGEHEPGFRVKAIEALVQRPESIPTLRAALLELWRDDSEVVRAAAFELLSARGWLPEEGTLALAPTEGGEISLSGSLAPSTDPEPKE
jgi:hypothetical protein